MGCDIHMYVERCHNEKWYCSDYFTSLRDNLDNMEMIPIYDGRNYALFATLAGVRNYGGVEPISDPKGLPDDCCAFVKKRK